MKANFESNIETQYIYNITPNSKNQLKRTNKINRVDLC